MQRFFTQPARRRCAETLAPAAANAKYRAGRSRAGQSYRNARSRANLRSSDKLALGHFCRHATRLARAQACLRANAHLAPW
uniref:Uncharacterized protein n=1 Tax=Ectopseudomonas mendocina (strain ymp) TaxID=399739 RepID=A4XQB3_ECTM1